MNRKIKPFHDFDQLTPEQLARVHEHLAESSYEKTRVLLRDEFQIHITYGRLRRYHQRHLETRQIKERVGVNLTVSDYIKVQNGEELPYGAVTHHLIQQAACQEAATGDHTITELLGLQRIANADFQQKLAREKLALEHRRQTLREEIARKPAPANPARTTPTRTASPQPNQSEEPAEQPFRMWTEEEVRTNQPKIEAAFRAHPVLRYIGLPPVEAPPTPPPDPDTPPPWLQAILPPPHDAPHGGPSAARPSSSVGGSSSARPSSSVGGSSSARPSSSHQMAPSQNAQHPTPPNEPTEPSTPETAKPIDTQSV